MATADVDLVRTIDGVETQVMIQTYSDRIMCLITQLGKVGSLVSYVR